MLLTCWLLLNCALLTVLVSAIWSDVYPDSIQDYRPPPHVPVDVSQFAWNAEDRRAEQALYMENPLAFWLRPDRGEFDCPPWEIEDDYVPVTVPVHSGSGPQVLLWGGVTAGTLTIYYVNPNAASDVWNDRMFTEHLRRNRDALRNAMLDQALTPPA